MLPWLLSDYRSTAAAMRTTAEAVAEGAVIPIEQRLDSLELACAGMWNLLKTKYDLTDEELIASIREVDARDGKLDGRLGIDPNETCPSCNRKVLLRRGAHCAWCGETLNRSPFHG